MKALFLEKQHQLALREAHFDEVLGDTDVRIQMAHVGICGSDIHYYQHGAIGPFVVKAPMVLGHEASGTVIEVGKSVTRLKVGDRVCMEPGIPNYMSSESLKGCYNLDPSVRFWATPPIHGVLRESVVHPEALTFKLPDAVSLEEGALVEPLAIGVHAAKKAHITPGDTALVLGAGTIGIVTALAAIAAGCSHVVLADTKKPKLDFVKTHYGDKISTYLLTEGDLQAHIAKTHPKGVDIVFEASGSAEAILSTTAYLTTGGKVVLIGMPNAPTPVDIVEAQTKEITFLSIFRYANVYERTIAFIASGQMKVKPLITHRFAFEESLRAFDFANQMPPEAIKIMIAL